MKYISADWPAPDNVHAVTTTRNGGMSRGPYDGLNVAEHVGDDVRVVSGNRALLCSEFSFVEEPVWLSQVHGTRIVDAAEISPGAEADGSVTDRSGIVCAIMTADCLPLFLCDAGGTRVGVLHVGWRGLAAGIIEKGLKRMKVAPAQVLAWSGPAIGPENFEIGNDVLQQLGGAARNYKPARRKGHYLANLYGLVEERLARAGVGYYASCNHCTFNDEYQFYSYRRDGATGRMASLAWLDD